MYGATGDTAHKQYGIEFSSYILEMIPGKEGEQAPLSFHLELFGVGDHFNGIDGLPGRAIDGAENTMFFVKLDVL